MAWQTPKMNWQTGDIPLADDFNRIEGNIQELQNTKETPAGAQAKVDTHAASKQTHGISGGYYIAKTSRSDQLPAWNDIQGKPSTFTPAAHTHSGSDITSAVANAINADTVDGRHSTDFMSSTKAYGTVTYNESLAAGGTKTKTIALGGQYKHGIAVFGEEGMAFFGTDMTKSKGISLDGSAPATLRIRSRDKDSEVFPGATVAGQGAAGDRYISVTDIYISGTSLVITFKNIDTETRTIKCTIAWEVW